MSPEQADGRSADPRSDVYSFGIMAWEMLVGRVPYSGPSAIAVLRKHLDEPVPSLSAARPGLPADLEAVVARALAKSPEARYASVAELAADLVRVGHTPELAELAAAGLPATARTIVGAPLSRAAGPVAATAPTVLTGGPGAASAGPDHTVRNAVLIVAGAVVLAGIIIGAAVGSRRPNKPPDQNVQVPVPPPPPPEPGRLCRLLPRGGGPPILARVLEVEGCLAKVQVELPGGNKVIRQVDLSRFGGIELVPDAPQPPKGPGAPGSK
jgi:serine/threonine-protein kinase